MSRSVGTHYRSEYSERTVQQAYPWHSASGEDETGSGAAAGGAPSAASGIVGRKTTEQLQEELNRLKEAGMPLETMKLVSNADLNALAGDTSRVFGLNERLARYAVYVGQLELRTEQLGQEVQALQKELADERRSHVASNSAAEDERRDLLNRVAAVEVNYQEALRKVDERRAAEMQLAQQLSDAKRAVEVKEADLQSATARARTAEEAADKLRTQVEEAGKKVPAELTAVGMGQTVRKEEFRKAVQEALAKIELGPRAGGAGAGAGGPGRGRGGVGVGSGAAPSAARSAAGGASTFLLREDSFAGVGFSAGPKPSVVEEALGLEAGKLPGVTAADELARTEDRLVELERKLQLKENKDGRTTRSPMLEAQFSKELAELEELSLKRPLLDAAAKKEELMSELAQEATALAEQADALRDRLAGLQQKLAEDAITPEEHDEMVGLWGKLPMANADLAAQQARAAELRQQVAQGTMAPGGAAELRRIETSLSLSKAEAGAMLQKAQDLLRKKEDGTITPEENAELERIVSRVATLEAAAEASAEKARAMGAPGFEGPALLSALGLCKVPARSSLAIRTPGLPPGLPGLRAVCVDLKC